MSKTAYLILHNGWYTEGTRFGGDADVTAELVFNTAMVGYLETLTDPSYHGQIVVETFPQIGNYGVIPADFESEYIGPSGFVVHDLCEAPSNFRSEGALTELLAARGVVGLCGVDTRALARQLREQGVMNAAIVSELPADVDAFAAGLAGLRLSADVYAVTCAAPYTLNPEGSPHIALWDFGAKGAIAKCLTARGCRVTVLPAQTGASALLALRPDGVLLSNGPGDPAAYPAIIAEVRRVAESGLPVFGICLGHQLLALALGGRTSKLKYGHRGANQPVRRTADGRCFITSQNHGYAVSELPPGAVASYVNLNDGSNEGIEYPGRNVFSVQFHPEACAGPKDAGALFDEFLRRTEV